MPQPLRTLLEQIRNKAVDRRLAQLDLLGQAVETKTGAPEILRLSPLNRSHRSAMSILVVCQTCKTRFQVSEKFAGKQGPCPKCKAVISISKLDEQVKIHAPEEYAGGGMVAAKDAQGRRGSQTARPRQDQIPAGDPGRGRRRSAGRLDRCVFAAWRYAILSDPTSSSILLGAGALLLAPPIVLGGYTAVRDAESEPYRGPALWLRAAIVSVVYAGLWGIAALFSTFVFAGSTPELWQLIPPTAIMIVGGTVAALATLDLEPANAFFHYAFYLAATVFLRVIMGLPPLGGIPASPSPNVAAVSTAWLELDREIVPSSRPAADA